MYDDALVLSLRRIGMYLLALEVSLKVLLYTSLIAFVCVENISVYQVAEFE